MSNTELCYCFVKQVPQLHTSLNLDLCILLYFGCHYCTDISKTGFSVLVSLRKSMSVTATIKLTNQHDHFFVWLIFTILFPAVKRCDIFGYLSTNPMKHCLVQWGTIQLIVFKFQFSENIWIWDLKKLLHECTW